MSKNSSFSILAGILSLATYNPALLKLEVSRICPACGSLNALHLHGSYTRKSERYFVAGQSLNLVKVLRLLCKYCGKSCSPLPECLPPKRWYLWDIQQSVIQEILLGKSIQSVSRNYGPARSTCRRWIKRLKEQFLEHANFLRNIPGNLGDALLHCVKLEHFWNKCFSRINLARAMLLCHRGGLPIP